MLRKQGYYEGYDNLVDPTLSNVFTIASQFRHSMMQDYIKLRDSKSMKIQFIPTHKQSFNPFPLWVYGKLESFLEGYAMTSAKRVDNSISEELTRHFYQRKNESIGYDQIAINLQTARLNGIPGYVAWRKICGLSEIHNFTDLNNIWENEEIVTIAQSIYKSVNDIDLLVGGLGEYKMKNASVGPTIGCILADQFSRIRKGDRFWYEGNIQILPFTPSQLESIRSTTLARVICDNTEILKVLQPNVLQKPSKSNPITLCKDSKRIPRVHYNAWKDHSQETKLNKAGAASENSRDQTHLISTSKSPLDYSGDDYSEPLIEDDTMEGFGDLNSSWVLSNANSAHVGNDEAPK